MTHPTLPGLYQHVGFPEYLRWPYLSQSIIKEGRKSMAHMRASFCEETADKEPSDAMVLGSALHVAFLEPETMLDRVAVWKGGRRYGAEWDAFGHDNSGKHILTQTMHEHLVGMTRSLRGHPQVRQWLSRIESTEVSAIGDIEGVTVKARGDALTSDPLIDLKTVADGDPRKIRRQAHDLGYYLQAAVHAHLLNRERFMLCTVESSPPYDVVMWEVHPEYMRLGMQEAIGIIQGWKHCEKNKTWPGRSTDIESLDIPEWLECNLTMSGTPLTV